MRRKARRTSFRLVVLFLLLLSFYSTTFYYKKRKKAKNDLNNGNSVIHEPLLMDAICDELEAKQVVIHVTREFDHAKMGGMGTILNIVADSQCLHGNIIPNVIIPYYSFLEAANDDFGGKIRLLGTVPVFISNSSINAPIFQYPISMSSSCSIHVWLIGRPYYFKGSGLVPEDGFETFPRSSHMKNIDLFHSRIKNILDHPELIYSFVAKDQSKIYPRPGSLPVSNLRKDMYFNSAIRSFLSDKQFGGRLFSHVNSVIHLHGASNAMLLQPSPYYPPLEIPAVYTFHDNSYEFEYVIPCYEFYIFFGITIPSPGLSCSRDPITNATSGEIRTSLMGLGMAAGVTSVSEEALQELFTSPSSNYPTTHFLHYHPEVITSIISLLNDIKSDPARKLLSIPNGLSFPKPSNQLITSLDPFWSELLRSRGLDFKFAGSLRSSIFNTKRELKNALLCKERIFQEDSDDRTLTIPTGYSNLENDFVCKGFKPENEIWVVFVGRFTNFKGFDLLSNFIKIISESGTQFDDNIPLVRIILMGQVIQQEHFESMMKDIHDALCFSRNKNECLNHKLRIHIKFSNEWQDRYGVLVRAASDLAWVPSENEGFGLVALEALLFGMPVLSTGVGGLKHFLIDPAVEFDSKHDLWLLLQEPKSKVQEFDDLQAKYWLSELEKCESVFIADEADVKPKPNPKACFELVKSDNRPMPQNAFLFNDEKQKSGNSLSSSSLKSAWIRFLEHHYFKVLRRAEIDREIYYWSLIAGSFAELMTRPSGPLDQYLSIYNFLLKK